MKSAREHLRIVQVEEGDKDFKNDEEYATREIRNLPGGTKLYYAMWEDDHCGYIWKTNYFDGNNNWVARVLVTPQGREKDLVLHCQANRLSDLLDMLSYRMLGWINGRISEKSNCYKIDDPKHEGDEEENETES